MKLYESAVIAGMALGGIYAIIAIGITQIFKVTRVLNFAHAGFVMWGAYLYSEWSPGAPAVKHMPSIVAALLAVVCTSGIGAVLYFIVFRVARRATNVGKIIASLGMFQVLLAAAVWVWGEGTRNAVPLIPTGFVSISKTHVTWTQLVNLGIALAVALAYVAMLRYSRFGLLTRAVTEDAERAELLAGARRDRIGMINWALAAGMGGIAGVFVCNLSGGFTNDEFFTFFTVALLATMIGGLQSLPLTVLGAVVFGLVDTLAGVRFNQPNSPDAALFLVFVIYIVVRRKWPSEVTQVVWTRPSITREGVATWSSFYQWVFWLGLAWVFLSIYAEREIVWGTTASLTIMYGLAAVSLVPILGWTGQVSLATPGIMGICSFVMADLMAVHHWPMAAAVIICLLIGTALSGALGLVTMRLGFVLTAVVTLAFTNAAQWLMNSSWLQIASLALTIGFPNWLGTPQHQYIVLAATAIIVLILLNNLRTSSMGPRMLGVKVAPRMLESFGMSPARLRVSAYAVSGAIAALAGMLYAVIIQNVSSQSFTSSLAVVVLQYAVIGGTASAWGPFIAAMLFVTVPQLFGLARFSGIPWTQVVTGLVVVGLVSLASDGIASLIKPPASAIPGTSLGLRLARRLNHYVPEPEELPIEELPVVEEPASRTKV